MSDDLADARWQIRDHVDALRPATRVEVHLGEVHGPYEAPESDSAPVAVVDDPVRIADLLRVLAAADPSARIVPHALDGLALHFLADDTLLGVVGLLSPRWVRGFWAYDAHLPVAVLTDEVTGLARPPWDPQAAPSIDAALAGAVVVPDPRWQWLSDAWTSRWPDHEPVGHRLRCDDRAIRFHSLPGSQRYPDDEDQYRVLLARHRTVLDELAASTPTSSRDVVVVTCSWSASAQPVPRQAPVAAAVPGARYWRSVLVDEDPDDRTTVRQHLFVDVMSLDDPALERLLRLVADDRTAGVVVMPQDAAWVYAPYDGGADVLPATLVQRDALAERHADWLPSTG